MNNDEHRLRVAAAAKAAMTAAHETLTAGGEQASGDDQIAVVQAIVAGAIMLHNPPYKNVVAVALMDTIERALSLTEEDVEHARRRYHAATLMTDDPTLLAPVSATMGEKTLADVIRRLQG